MKTGGFVFLLMVSSLLVPGTCTLLAAGQTENAECVPCVTNNVAKLDETRHAQRCLVVHDDFTLENRFKFTWADEFDGEWEVMENGISMHREPFDVPHIAPQTKESLNLPEFKAEDGKVTEVKIYFLLKKDKPWAKAGSEVACSRIALKPPLKPL